MVRINFKGVYCTYKRHADGTVKKVYWYHRATGNPLRGEPGTPEFLQDYLAAESHRTVNQDGTFNSLIRKYTLSTEFDETLAPSTKAEYRRMLTKAEKVFGDLPIEALTDWRIRKDLLDWREEANKKSGAREADNCLSVISAMLTWAVQRAILPINHLRGFKRLYHSERSDIIWLREHILAFLKVAPIELQYVLILALHTGLRLGDLILLPWSAYDGQFIKVRPRKTQRLGSGLTT